MSFYGTPMARENFDDPKLLVLAVQHSTGMYLAWAANEGKRGGRMHVKKEETEI